MMIDRMKSELAPPPTPYAVTAGRDISALLLSIMDYLTLRERQALLLRFGIGNDSPMTLAEAGKAMGISKERFRQLEAKALRKLRHPQFRYIQTELELSLFDDNVIFGFGHSKSNQVTPFYLDKSGRVYHPILQRELESVSIVARNMAKLERQLRRNR